MGFLVAHMVKNLSAMQETQVRSLGWEDPLEEGTATHSSILAWRILWTEEPGGPQSTGLQKSRRRLSDRTATLTEYQKGKGEEGHAWGCSFMF